MKKILSVLLLGILVLTACEGNEEVSEPISDPNVEEENKPTQEELNAQLKEDAVEANFIELNGEEADPGKKVFATGEVSAIQEDGIFQAFTLTTEEKDGYGMYSIRDIFKETPYKNGDVVTIYGTYDGKSELGMPEIISTVIEVN